MRHLVCLAFAASLLSTGCAPQAHPPEARNDVTSGHIILVCSPEAREVIDRGVAEFERLYPKANIEVRAGGSRDAVAALFGARADLAVITRELLQEERKAAVQGRLPVDGYRFARDAAVIIVHPSNPVDHMTLDDVRRVYRGEIQSWSELGGRHEAVVPVVQPADADLTEFFVQEVLGGDPIIARSLTANSDHDVVRTVLDHPGAIGYVTLSRAGDGARVLRLAALKGLPYYLPDLETVHDGTYPVTRFYNLYARSKGPALANGFITYITSLDGQRLIRDIGLVPTSVPVRFVRRSPMLSTHTHGDSSSTP